VYCFFIESSLLVLVLFYHELSTFNLSTSYTTINSTHENLPIEGNIKNDTSYNNVLISKDEWWYFGDQAPEIPLSFQKFIHKRNHKYFFKDSDYFELIEWVIANYPKRGRYGLPNEWIKIRDNYESK